MGARFVTLVAAASLAAVGLASSASASDATPPAVAFVGDSTGADAREEIALEVARSRPLQLFMAAGMATLRSSLPQITEAALRPDTPPIWVIALGHAYANAGFSNQTFREDMRAVLDAVAPHVSCVRWFEITEQRTFYAGVNERARAFNRILRSVSAEYDNVEVMHYAHWARLAPVSVWIPDGLHHTAEGQWEMGRLVRQAADGCDAATNSGPFWDVPNDAPGARAIAWLGEHQYATGYANGTYRAVIGSVEVPASRGAVAAALWRRAGAPREAPFARWSDADPPYRHPLSWIAAQHLAPAYPDGTYRPEEPATRGHMALLLWRLAGRPEGRGRLPWSDVPDRLRDALAWLAAHRGARVFRDPAFQPGRPLTRTELALLLAPPAAAAPDGGDTAVPPPAPTEYVVLDEGQGPPLGASREAGS